MGHNILDQFSRAYNTIRDEITSVIVGNSDPIDVCLAAFFSEGHILIEGTPGVGKTLLASSIAQASGLCFRKIQFTPDLMPADITGTYVIREEQGKRGFEFRKGPLFANVVLGDEINRATPKTQSALLEGMQERCVTSGNETFPLPRPFMVIGTQNPIEMKGTYPLPEAQKDRFMFKVDIGQSNIHEIGNILERTMGNAELTAQKVSTREEVQQVIAALKDVAVPEHLRAVAARIVKLTDPGFKDAPDIVSNYVRLGSSVRGGQALIAGARVHAVTRGKVNIDEKDIKRFVIPALRHRIILAFEAGASGISTVDVLEEIMGRI